MLLRSPAVQLFVLSLIQGNGREQAEEFESEAFTLD